MPDFDPNDIDWASLQHSPEWAQIVAYVGFMLENTKFKMEDPTKTVTIDDLRYQQGRLSVLRDLSNAPTYYLNLQKMLRENERGAGKRND